MRGQIFINYRHEESAWSARSLFDRLTQRFGREQVFMDVEKIEVGSDLVKAIEVSLSSCDVLIAVIGAHWLSAVDPQGGRRLDHPEDFVRLEIATALRREICVIPVLVDGAKMPEDRELPYDLKSLTRRKAFPLSQERFRSDSWLLIEVVDKALRGAARAERRKLGSPFFVKRTWRSVAGVLAVLALAIVAAILYFRAGTSPDVLIRTPSPTPTVQSTVPGPAVSSSPFVIATPIGKLLLIFQGHTGAVYSAVFSPDGQRVLTASFDNTARLWEAESGKLLETFKGHSNPVNSAVFSPDGRRVLTASFDNTARLWEAESGKLLDIFRHDGAVYSAIFSPDGREVLTASSDNTARLWEAESGTAPKIRSSQLQETFQGHTGAVYSAVLSPDGRWVLTASRDKTARLWEAESGKPLETFQGRTDGFSSAVFSPDGRRVLTASFDNTAQLWEAESGRLQETFQGHHSLVNCAVFSPDGQRVLTASWDKTARLWEAKSGRLVSTYQGHHDTVYSAVFSPDGQRVLTASKDKTARLWEAESGQLLAIFQGHSDGVKSAVFSPDGRRVLTASADATARLWEAEAANP
jgi:WD40 repeat protein